MTIPPLPPHYYQPGKSAFDAAPYCTNAITAPDRPGNRLPLPTLKEAEITHCGSFQALICGFSTCWRAWIWRDGADVALWYREIKSESALRRSMEQAIDEQLAIDGARGFGAARGETVDLLKRERSW